MYVHVNKSQLISHNNSNIICELYRFVPVSLNF